MKVALLMLTLCSIAGMTYAQTGTIKGSITTRNGRPVPNVNIHIEHSKRGAVSKEDGSYVIYHIQPGHEVVKVSAVGLNIQKKNITIRPGESLEVNFVVDGSIKELNSITVKYTRNILADKASTYVARMPLGYLENPQVYSVISDTLMKEQMITDIQGALQNTPGVNNIVEGVGSGGVGLTANLRGFSTDIAIRNGMATNYITLSDPVNLERIEVIKGPSATLFGSTLISYGGLINRVTKQPLSYFRGEVGYTAGSFGLSRLTADINTPLNTEKTVLFRVNVAHHIQESFQDYGHQRNWAISPNLLYKINDRLTLDLEAELFHTERPSTYFGISPGVMVKSFDKLSYAFKHSYSSDELQSRARVTNLFARATYKLFPNWVSQTNYSYGNTDNLANYLFLTFIDNSAVRRMPMHITGNFHTSQIQQNLTGHFSLGKIQNRLLVGLDYTSLITNDRRTRFIMDTVSNQSPDKDFNHEKYQETLAHTQPFAKYKRNTGTFSAYISDVINITDRLDIMASIRLDHFNNKLEGFTQTAWSPKFGLVYQLVRKKLSLFANYMDGFKNVAPDNTNPENIKTFKPEHAKQLEGGIKADLFSHKLSATISYYDITVRNIVRSIPDNDNIGGFNSIQDGTRSSKGLEVELIANPLKGWNLMAGYGYNDSRYTKASKAVEGHRPYSTPLHSANFWTSYRIMSGRVEGLGIGLGGNYVGDSYLDDANTFIVPAYTVLNATFFYDRPRYRIGFKLNNIGNEKYWASAYWARPQETRNFSVNITVRF